MSSDKSEEHATDDDGAYWMVLCDSEEQEAPVTLKRGLTWEEACDFFEQRVRGFPQLKFLLAIDQELLSAELNGDANESDVEECS